MAPGPGDQVGDPGDRPQDLGGIPGIGGRGFWAARPSHAHRPVADGGGLRRWRGSPPLTLLAVALGVMMVGLDGTIVAVANPAIQSTCTRRWPASSGSATPTCWPWRSA